MTEQTLLEFGPLQLHMDSRRCSAGGRAVTLTPMEFSILSILCQEQGAPVSARELFRRIWGEDYYYEKDGSIMVHICHLREKLGPLTGSRKCIQTVRGVGYKIAA